MNPNNYLICNPVGNHEIEVNSKIYTVLFDQYNSLGFDWKIDSYFRLPHYFQEENSINELKAGLNLSLNNCFPDFLFDTSGSVAVEHAIHYSQLYTGKKRALKFRGCYHGSTLAIKQLDQDPLCLPHNQEDAIVNIPPFSYRESIEQISKRLSTLQYGCIIIDPNFCDYLIKVPDEYWTELRALCDQFGVLIILDEMRTAFRSEKIWWANQLPIDIDFVIGGKALSNGLPFSLTGIHTSIYEEKIYHKVNEYCTGFSYNPLIFANVYSIFKTLYALYRGGFELIDCLKQIAQYNQKPFLSIDPKGYGLVMSLKTLKPTLMAAFCEAKLKEKGVLIYRAENKYIIYPHFNFPVEKLKSILQDLIEIVCNCYGSKRKALSC